MSNVVHIKLKRQNIVLHTAICLDNNVDVKLTSLTVSYGNCNNEPSLSAT